MDINTTTQQITNLSAEKKASFYGMLLAVAGSVFLLAGVMLFIVLLVALYLKLALFVAFLIGTLVTGLLGTGLGIWLLSKSKK